MSRIEDQIKALLNGEAVEIKPQSRAEQYLQACINGTGVEGLPTPMSRLEVLLYQLAENPPGGSGGSGGSGGGVGESFLTFYDYDGTILHSYSEAEVAEMSELPPLPERKGLICQGWNYDLETIKSYNRPVNVGATYITDDGKTRLYITIAAEGRMDVPLYFRQSVANGVIIDWGDGSPTETANWTGYNHVTHTYASVGDYVISMDVTDGCYVGLGTMSNSYSVLGTAAYSNMLRKVEVGNGVDSLVSNACKNCYSLENIVIPKGTLTIYPDSFSDCHSLKSIVIPNSVTQIGSNAFSNCYSLKSIVIPNSVTKIDSNAFSNCYSLKSIVIPNSVTLINSGAFYCCHLLESIAIPENVISINYNVFYNCQSLENIVIPNSVTQIGTSAFYGCHSLKSIVIPNSVTKIDSNAFSACSCIKFYDFTKHTSVPTLSSSNPFISMASDCEIWVPTALYDEWIAATNWSTHASKIIAKS